MGMTTIGFVRHFAAFLREDPQTGCWLWTGGRDADGYGKCTPPYPGAPDRAHLVSWEAANPTARRYDTDVVMHMCNRRECCAPRHLALGSKSDNAQHSVAFGTHANAAKSACPRGHHYDEANTHVSRAGKRSCRACAAARAARRRNGDGPGLYDED